jgi:hypothetical protein
MTARRGGTLAVLAVAVLAAVLTGRELALGAAEVAASDAAAGRSDWTQAIAHARAAAEALAPGSPWPERGRARLEAIGHDAEGRGDDATALLAYGALRTAALATRAPFSNSPRVRAQAEEALARVASSSRADANPAADPTRPKGPDAMLDALRDDESPPTWTLALLGASALAMLGGLAPLAWLDHDGGRARVAKVVAAIGFAVYALVSLTR